MKLLFVIWKITISIYRWNYDRGALSGYGEHEGLTGVSFEKCDNDRGENLTVRAESSRHRIAYIAARYYDLSFRNPSISRFVTEPTSGSRRTTISGVPCDHTRTYTSVENAKFSNDRFSLLYDFTLRSRFVWFPCSSSITPTAVTSPGGVILQSEIRP